MIYERDENHHSLLYYARKQGNYFLSELLDKFSRNIIGSERKMTFLEKVSLFRKIGLFSVYNEGASKIKLYDNFIKKLATIVDESILLKKIKNKDCKDLSAEELEQITLACKLAAIEEGIISPYYDYELESFLEGDGKCLHSLQELNIKDQWRYLEIIGSLEIVQKESKNLKKIK